MHIKSIVDVGGRVLGEASLSSVLPLNLSAKGGHGTMLLNGADAIRIALPSEWGQHPVLSFWSSDFIKQLAELKQPAV